MQAHQDTIQFLLGATPQERFQRWRDAVQPDLSFKHHTADGRFEVTLRSKGTPRAGATAATAEEAHRLTIERFVQRLATDEDFRKVVSRR